jgi:hypothetical protein
MRNRIINGAMVIDQRNAGASVTITNTAANTYAVDRFYAYGSQASKFSVQQNAGSVTPPVGFVNYLGITSLSAYSITSTDQFLLGQRIEGFNAADLGWGTANAKTVTLSFQVYSSLTGTFGGAINNGAFNRSYPFSYSIPVANTWTTISVTIAGDTTGTWTTTNGIFASIVFNLGSGSTYSTTANAWAAGNFTAPTGATSVVGTNGATFYITGIQLERGTQATSFEYRQYGTELSLCQRYAQKLLNNPNGTAYSINGLSTAGTTGLATTSLPVTMRTNPTLTYSALSDFAATTQGSGGTTSVLSLTGSTPLSITLTFTCPAAGFAVGYPLFIYPTTANSFLLLSAEL